jgi:hypothetical protein
MKRIGIVASLCAVVALSACKDFTASGDPLTSTEANELAEELMGQGFPGLGGIGAAPPAAPSAEAAPAAPAERITITINDSNPCEGGGTVALAGTLTADVNQQAQTGKLEYRFTLTPAACVFTTRSNKTFTITGDPNLKSEGNLDWTSTGFQGTFTYKGKFQWTASDGRAGACGVDLEANINVMTGTSGTASASLKGSVCGATVDQNVSLTS